MDKAFNISLLELFIQLDGIRYIEHLGLELFSNFVS